MLWTFEDFYNHYDKKVGKKAAEKAWAKNVKSATIIKSIMNHTPRYVASTPDKKYRKHPATYLNGHSWEDEIIEKKQGSGWGGAANTLIDLMRNGGQQG